MPARSAEDVVRGLERFFTTLWSLAHSPLLAALARYLMTIRLGIAVDLSDGRRDLWSAAGRDLAGQRIALVDALAAGDAERASALMAAHHAHLLSIIDALPRGVEIRLLDPGLADYLSAFISGRIAGG